MDDDFLKRHNLAEIKGEPFIIDMMYAVAENITMHPVYEETGFGRKAYAHIDVVDRLKKVAEQLKTLNLKMRIRDAYRPPVAHQRILDILPVKGLFASKPENSLHCYGTAIDCCLTDKDGHDLEFPTAIDAYEKKYAEQIAKGKTDDFYKHFEKAAADYDNPETAKAIENRELLKKIMTDCGFAGISSEWWHFQLPKGKELYPMIEWNQKQPDTTEA